VGSSGKTPNCHDLRAYCAGGQRGERTGPRTQKISTTKQSPLSNNVKRTQREDSLYLRPKVSIYGQHGEGKKNRAKGRHVRPTDNATKKEQRPSAPEKSKSRYHTRDHARISLARGNRKKLRTKRTLRVVHVFSEETSILRIPRTQRKKKLPWQSGGEVTSPLSDRLLHNRRVVQEKKRPFIGYDGRFTSQKGAGEKSTQTRLIEMHGKGRKRGTKEENDVLLLPFDLGPRDDC